MNYLPVHYTEFHRTILHQRDVKSESVAGSPFFAHVKLPHTDGLW